MATQHRKQVVPGNTGTQIGNTRGNQNLNAASPAYGAGPGSNPRAREGKGQKAGLKN